MVAPVAKGPVLERADLEDLVVQRTQGLLLEVDDGHDEVATREKATAASSPVSMAALYSSRRSSLSSWKCTVLGAQADLLVHSRSAATLLGREVGEDGVDGAGLADEVLGEQGHRAGSSLVWRGHGAGPRPRGSSSGRRLGGGASAVC